MSPPQRSQTPDVLTQTTKNLNVFNSAGAGVRRSRSTPPNSKGLVPEGASLELLRWGHRLMSLQDRRKDRDRPIVLEDWLDLFQSMEQLEMLQADKTHKMTETLDTRQNRFEISCIIANLLWDRFEQSRSLEDLDMTIRFEQKVLQLIPDHSPDLPKWLSKLGVSYQNRFDELGELGDITTAVRFMDQASSLTPDDRPAKPLRLSNLGSSYQSLFGSSGRLEDMDRAVVLKEQAMILTPDDHPVRPQWLSELGTAYAIRFERLGNLEDMEKAVGCQEQAVLSTPDDHPRKPGLLSNLSGSYMSLFKRLGSPEVMNESLRCIEQAVLLTPDGHPNRPAYLNNLGNIYTTVFRHLGRLEDIDKAISCQEQAVTLTPDGHPNKFQWLSNLGCSYNILFERLDKLEDLNKAINCHERAMSLVPYSHLHRPGWLINLSTSYQLLFERRGVLEDLGTAISCQEQAVGLTPDDDAHKPQWLHSLSISYRMLFERQGRPEDIDTAVKWAERAVSLTPDGHSEKHDQLSNLGNTYLARFQRLGQMDDVDKSISYQEQAVSFIPDDSPTKARQLSNLASSYTVKFQHTKLPADAINAMLVFRHASILPSGYPAVRLHTSYNWAQLSVFLSLSPLEAYTHAMTLLPQVVWLGASVQSRHESLATLDVRSLATNAAAAAISSEHYNQAVEWLEQGRSVVWSQMLQLRTPLDDLQATYPEIAAELKQVSYQLERVSLPHSDLASSQEGDSQHNISQMHRRLAERWEQLLDSVRQLPGLEGFLCPPTLSKLADMVHDGAAVIINVHMNRCDALVLRAGTRDVVHVPLVSFSLQKATDARTNLSACLRSEGVYRGVKGGKIRSRVTFQDVLAMLWYDVVKPILDHLGINQILPIDDLPHITWCTTGALASMPIHAAGDYNDRRTVLANLAISSYAPTISSLGQSATSPSTFSGILAVGHESSLRGLNSLPGTKAELDQVETQTKGLLFTRLDGANASTDSVLAGMRDHSWVHFACHASQNPLDPMSSAFHLHDRDLDLATIARNPFKNAQLAFLSACQTATGDETLPDEAVHLAAGLLMAGYPTVIATMWSIHDLDAPIIAGKVYECLLEGGVPDSRRAAKALHKAVAYLRDEFGVKEFARWAPYIHMGR